MKENIIIRRMRMKAIRRCLVKRKVFPSIKMITCIFLVSEFDDYFDLSFYVFSGRCHSDARSFFSSLCSFILLIIWYFFWSMLDSSRIFHLKFNAFHARSWLNKREKKKRRFWKLCGLFYWLGFSFSLIAHIISIRSGYSSRSVE